MLKMTESLIKYEVGNRFLFLGHSQWGGSLIVSVRKGLFLPTERAAILLSYIL